MRIAVATIVRGRRLHLERQQRAVQRLHPAPCDYVVVGLDAEPRDVAGRFVHRPVADDAALPLAAARNLAIEEAAGADLVVCLDADCVPEPHMLAAYGAAARGAAGPMLLAGPVGRLGRLDDRCLDPGDDALEASRRAARSGPRPVPGRGEVRLEPRVELFWSLAFAVAPATHARIGGFDPGYVGYGAEDTDYALRARAAGVPLAWVGDAWAHHQHHPVSSPPVEHLSDIARNARRFHALWGSWPMGGWLAAFADAGLIRWHEHGAHLEVVAA